MLERYGRLVNEVVGRTLAPPAAGAEAVRAWFHALIEAGTRPAGPRGCLFIGTVSACATAPEPLREKVIAAVRASTDRLQQALERDPQIARRENVRALARFFAAEGHGLAVLARAGVRRPELEAAAEVALRVLECRH